MYMQETFQEYPKKLIIPDMLGLVGAINTLS